MSVPNSPEQLQTAQLRGLLLPGAFDKAFETHFQPIVDLRKGAILGYEALTRGPAGTPFHKPLELLAIAHRSGLLIALESALLRLIVRRFEHTGLAGQLFINVTSDTLLAARTMLPDIAKELSGIKVNPQRLVIELTELPGVRPPDSLRQAVSVVHDLGISHALDDLGLQVNGQPHWVALRPGYVKLKGPAIAGIAADVKRLARVRALVHVANQLGARLVAEGIEQEADALGLRSAGVELFQGFLLAAPEASPPGQLGPSTMDLAQQSAEPEQADAIPTVADGILDAKSLRAGDLARMGKTVRPSMPVRDVVAMFLSDIDLFSVVVTDPNGAIAGMLRRMDVLTKASMRYFMDVYRNKPCSLLMDPQPLQFDSEATLTGMAERVANLRESHLMDGFLVYRDGSYVGTGRVNDLLRAVNQLQLQHARNANPLTHLPGNLVILQELEVRLHAGEPFALAYFDLDHFKAYNDVYGYKQGDEIILACARVIQRHLNARHDFLGHIGGDDFIALLHSTDWEERMRDVLQDFDAEVASMFEPEHVKAGGYSSVGRNGEALFHPLTSLSIAVIPVPANAGVEPAVLASLAADAKKHAKMIRGSSLFIERRQLQSALAGG